MENRIKNRDFTLMNRSLFGTNNIKLIVSLLRNQIVTSFVKHCKFTTYLRLTLKC